ncbi:MAG: aspartate carbamoyltransferase regulatory subunit [Bacteroidales bacterium]|nr:aspartate carbamoyltransferase regulatory subunit [Bacteroidales bacterium]
MKNKRTELQVSAISNGTVIDHISSENTFRVFQILNLDQAKNQVYVGTNLDSKKLGKKGIIKISGRFFKPDEINKIALAAPQATLIEIRDYVISKKEKIVLPKTVEKVVKCYNPKCVTNHQQIPTRFNIVKDHHGVTKLACHYCEKTMVQEDIIFV